MFQYTARIAMNGSANGAAAPKNNKHLSFVDEAWLHAFGLSAENALDYFALSMFYDYTSNNQAIRTQGSSVSQLLNMTGLEFALEVPPQEPPVYIVKKQNRVSTRIANVLEVFYIINGVIYQSPSLMDVMSTRLMKTTHYLDKALSVMAAEHTYSNKSGHVTFKAVETEAAEKDKSQRVDLISRELPSMESTLEDVAAFCSA